MTFDNKQYGISKAQDTRTLGVNIARALEREEMQVASLRLGDVFESAFLPIEDSPVPEMVDRRRKIGDETLRLELLFLQLGAL